jgi:hypothetical protein
MSDEMTTTVLRKTDVRLLVIAGILGVAVGWWAATSPASPVKPAPERPVLRFLAKLAKTGLWVMMFAEQPPAEQHYVVHARVDENGHRVLDHGKGW